MPDIEILAPVGNRAMLNAALAAGADAVYLGGKTGNARAFAGNFSDEELKTAIRDCHLEGVKVYVTLNTLVKAHEMDEMLFFADTAAEAGADAVILQDPGLARALRERWPALPLHASTQMNVRSLAGVLQMESMGFERVIPGRETTLEELARMRDGSSMEIEVFVHGSLCVSVSGQCLLSGLIGGRSGNRGRCAQICRKRYTGIKKTPDTLLSLRDLNTLDAMDTWRELGITSLKIEGRMKKPEYVYAVTKMVRAALEGKSPETDLLDVSSRSFTRGFALGDFGRTAAQTESTGRGTPVGAVIDHRGGRAVKLSRSVSKQDTLQILTQKNRELPITLTGATPAGGILPLPQIPDAKTGSQVRRVYAGQIARDLEDALKQPKKFPVSFTFHASMGAPAVLKSASGEYTCTVTGELAASPARKQPVTAEDIRKRLQKTGNTRFLAEEIQIEWPDDAFLPMGEINRIRRDALEMLTEQMAERPERTKQRESAVRVFAPQEEPRLHIEAERVTDLSDIAVERVARVYLESTEGIGDLREYCDAEVYGILPEPSDQAAEQWAEQAARLCDGFLVKDPGGIHIAKQLGLPFQIDASLHCMNDRAADLLLEDGAMAEVTASIEMSGEEMRQASFLHEAEVIAFGPVVAMKLKQCPFSVEKGCANDASCANCHHAGAYLTEETGDRYYVTRHNGFSRLYFSRTIDRIDRLADSPVRPKAYRLVLKPDPVNPQLVSYAITRLLEKKKAKKPALKTYWKTEGTTDARWTPGVE